MMLKKINPSYMRFAVIYFITFLFTLHVALPSYVNSSLLNSFLPESAVGMMYAIASLIMIFGFALYPKILNKWGNYRTTKVLILSLIGLLIAIAIASSPYVVIPSFILFFAFFSLGFFNLDIFLEHYSKDETTGVLRGIMFTVINMGVLLGPLIAGIIISNNDFWKIYLISAVLLVPILVVLSRNFKAFADSIYDPQPLFGRMKEIVLARHPDDQMRHVMTIRFILIFFFSWMVIYLPIYLNQYMGFSWREIGIILPIAMLPFVLFELPTGQIMDKKGNERQFMTMGFLTAALFAVSLFFVIESSLVVWAALLFGVRAGMSFVEISAESYFFKHISDGDTKVLSLYHDMRPVAYIIGPITGSLLLLFFPMKYLFVVLAGALILGAIVSTRIKPENLKTQGPSHVLRPHI
jgi:MFS family permease